MGDKGKKNAEKLAKNKRVEKKKQVWDGANSTNPGKVINAAPEVVKAGPPKK